MSDLNIKHFFFFVTLIIAVTDFPVLARDELKQSAGQQIQNLLRQKPIITGKQLNQFQDFQGLVSNGQLDQSTRRAYLFNFAYKIWEDLRTIERGIYNLQLLAELEELLAVRGYVEPGQVEDLKKAFDTMLMKARPLHPDEIISSSKDKDPAHLKTAVDLLTGEGETGGIPGLWDKFKKTVDPVYARWNEYDHNLRKKKAKAAQFESVASVYTFDEQKFMENFSKLQWMLRLLSDPQEGY